MASQARFKDNYNGRLSLYPPSPVDIDVESNDKDDDKDRVSAIEMREIMRTPSPTPSEVYVLKHKTRLCDYRRLLNFRKMNKQRLWALATGLFLATFFILFLVFENHILTKLRPFATWMHQLPGGWVLPIVIMIIMSFPPLFGQEVIAILCGDVWGIWIGFGIVAAGTILGELASFYVFKTFCVRRGKQMEEKQVTFALYAQIVREGGLKIPMVMRFSAIPGHFLTALFSTCGMKLWVFLVAATLGLPKQLATVYIGIGTTNGPIPKTTKILKIIVILVTVLTTSISMRWLGWRMDKVKERMVYARRKQRQTRAQVTGAITPSTSNSAATSAVPPLRLEVNGKGGEYVSSSEAASASALGSSLTDGAAAVVDPSISISEHRDMPIVTSDHSPNGANSNNPHNDNSTSPNANKIGASAAILPGQMPQLTGLSEYAATTPQ